MDIHDSAGLGVNLIAYIRAEMGLGTAARGLAMAMESANVPFNVINFEHANPGRHRDDSWRHKETDHSSHDFTILAVNPDNLSNATARIRNGQVRDHYTIGYWFWELPEIPDAWLSSFSLVNEVWAGSHFVQDAISLKSPVPVFRVPVPVYVGPTGKLSRRDFSLPKEQFLFLSISDTHSELARKNPLGAIRAFKKAFPGDNERAGLVVKISNVHSIHADHEIMGQIREEIEGQRNIYLMDRNIAREEIDALLDLSNCFVSLHRAEGFGLGPAEAMSLGKPTILTNWSGNMDYMTPQNSIAIDYRLVPLGRQYGPYPADQFWAEPDLEQAAFWMRRLANDPDLAGRIGKLGQETIQNDFSPVAVGKLIRGRLTSLRALHFSNKESEARADEIALLSPQLEAAQREIASRDTQRDQTRQELISESGKLIERDPRIEHCLAELSSTQKQLTRAADDFNRAREELILMKKENSFQKNALEETVEQMASVQKELALKRGEIEEAERELAATMHELTRVAGEFAILKRRLIDRQTAIGELHEKPLWQVFIKLHRFIYGKSALPDLDNGSDSPEELNPQTFWLEHPTGPSTREGIVPVSGWVVTPSGETIDGVQAIVNGEKASGVHGLERPDVSAAHKGRSDYLHSGFMIELTLPVGVHQISLQWLTRSSGWDTFCSFQHEVREAME